MPKAQTTKPSPAIRLLSGFYQPWLIAGILALFVLFFSFPYHFVPDYCHLSELADLRAFTWSLLTVTLGFSGLILTLLLLSYNFYFKSTRRNTLEFIVDNRYLKILFSGFVGLLLVQVLAYLAVNRENRQDHIAVFYFLLVLTISYILAQLPLALLGLKYSTSIDRITRVFAEIERNDVAYLVSPAAFIDTHPIEEIESNRIVLLKDIGLNAIKDSDWVLPQKILNLLYDLVAYSFEKEQKNPLASRDEALYCLLWVSKHFQRAAVKNGDHITISVIYGQTLMLYGLLAAHKLHQQDFISPVDEFFKELMFNLIQSKDFAESRDHWVRDYTGVMAECLLSMTYSDEELPTHHHIFSKRTGDIVYPSAQVYYGFWLYLNNSQVHNLAEVIEFAVKQNDNRLYDTYHWQIRNLISRIDKAETLTDSQKRDYLGELLLKTGKLDELALENGLNRLLPVISHLEIAEWARYGGRYMNKMRWSKN